MHPDCQTKTCPCYRRAALDHAAALNAVARSWSHMGEGGHRTRHIRNGEPRREQDKWQDELAALGIPKDAVESVREVD